MWRQMPTVLQWRSARHSSWLLGGTMALGLPLFDDDTHASLQLAPVQHEAWTEQRTDRAASNLPVDFPLIYPGLTALFAQMDMGHDHTSTTSSTSSAISHEGMTPYLHFTPGDVLYFSAWTPSSPGAMVGACIGLFMLALFERWFAALRGVFEHHWKHRALLLSSRYSTRPEGSEFLRSNSRSASSSPNPKEKDSESATRSPVPPLIPRYRPRTIPPFVASQDIPRGIMYAFHMFIGYLLMLAVMYVSSTVPCFQRRSSFASGRSRLDSLFR
ncbi:Ctr copper transporter family-domain-containing protein [Ephemerocybe angulata]|uniref:Copper transport protein n=1 Tax=Ephemerocybe angulata TaxID=980116 RepID=A0A8H6MHD6_9AGAR|nr:Ctr copper transporter family-domain-containing protein [Tulosesus angulatus]